MGLALRMLGRWLDAGEEKGWRSREAGWWGNNLDMNLTSEQVNGPILAG